MTFSALDRLQPVLAAHTADTDEERAHLEATLSFLSLASAPLLRSSFTPGHATGSAFVVSPTTNSILLIHHARLNRWLQPGGHAEPDEFDLATTARRELLEETGLDFEAGSFVDIDVHEIPARKAEPTHLHFDFRYLVILPAPRVVRAASDACDVRWVSMSELATLNVDDGIRRVVRKCQVRGLLHD